MPKIFMIAGPNGAGKTTSAVNLLPDILHCEEYINADSIAAALSPFKPEEMAFQAGRVMLERIHQLAKKGKDFAFETTGASKTFVRFLLDCQRRDYSIYLLYLWLESPELALERVATRVDRGGHNIPTFIVRRRYQKGMKNIFQLYMPIVDGWVFYDNSGDSPRLIARKGLKSDIMIDDKSTWKVFMEIAR